MWYHKNMYPYSQSYYSELLKIAFFPNTENALSK